MRRRWRWPIGPIGFRTRRRIEVYTCRSLVMAGVHSRRRRRSLVARLALSWGGRWTKICANPPAAAQPQCYRGVTSDVRFLAAARLYLRSVALVCVAGRTLFSDGSACAGRRQPWRGQCLPRGGLAVRNKRPGPRFLQSLPSRRHCLLEDWLSFRPTVLDCAHANYWTCFFRLSALPGWPWHRRDVRRLDRVDAVPGSPGDGRDGAVGALALQEG